MKRANVRILFVLSTILAAAIAATAQQKAPDLSFRDINGKAIRVSDLKGKVVLLNFWATWCVPCRAEMPDLVKLQRRYRSRDLRIIGITFPPERISEIRRFMRALKINYPIIVGSKETKQAFTSSDTLPLTVVIDREGNIREIIEGIMYSDEFNEKVKPLLSSPAPAQRSDFGSRFSVNSRSRIGSSEGSLNGMTGCITQAQNYQEGEHGRELETRSCAAIK